MQAEADSAERETVLLATRALVGIAARSLASISDDVSLAQYRVLVLIEGRGPQTAGELAQSLDVNPSTVTRVCDRLADKKLIRRHAPANDRRTVRVELSAHGRRLVEQVMNRRRSYIDQTLNRMTVDVPQTPRREPHRVRGSRRRALRPGLDTRMAHQPRP